MQGKNHVGLALAAPLGLALAGAAIPLPATVTAWGALVIGSLAPDLDGGGTIARPSKFLPDIIPNWLQKLLDTVGLKLSGIIRVILGHRGGLHWPLWAGLMIWAGGRYELEWLLWFGAGYLLHIVGDLITVAGVPILGPISQKKVSFFPMRTGGRLESVMGLALWGFVLWRLSLIGLHRAGGAADQVYHFIDLIKYHLSIQ